MKQALENKRRLERDSADNFRVATVEDRPGVPVDKRRRTRVRAGPLFSPSAGALDPFQSLAVDSSRLQALLGNCRFLFFLNFLSNQ